MALFLSRNKKFVGKESSLFSELILSLKSVGINVKQLLDEVEHDIINYQNRGLCYLPKPKAEADNTDMRF